MSILVASPTHAEPAADNRQLSITVVESENGGHYQEFTQALRKLMAGQDIKVVPAVPSEAVPASGLVIGVGMKAAAYAAAGKAPYVLNVLIPEAGQDKLLREFPLRAQSHDMSAVFLDQPIGRQVELIAAAFPGLRNIGVLYGSAPEKLAQLKKIMAGHGMVLHQQEVTPMLPLPDALQILLQHIDLLLALPDPGIYNSSTLRNILLSTYRSGIPLVGFSPAYVNAGALCAVASTPGQIAAQVAGMISEMKQTGKLPEAQYPRDFDVWVNEQVARSLGIDIGEASALRESIKAAERSAQ